MNQVTIIVVPRERFSYTQPSLESVYQNTGMPFNLVYVDGNSPPHIGRYLEAQTQQRGFQLVRSKQYLSPNRARNLGLAQVNFQETQYVAIIDNDVLVRPGWLESLVQCAETTDAGAVGPLYLEGSDFQTVHMAGGTSVFREQGDRRWLVEKRPFMRLPLAKVADKLQRHQTDILELHCILVRAEVMAQIGSFDERMVNIGEESDFSMTLRAAGHSIYFEPSAVVSYVPPPPLAPSDLPFFFVRWSQQWCQQSVAHFQEKWNLTENSPTLHHYREFVDRHRYLVFTQPQKGKGAGYLTKKATYFVFDKLTNRYASRLHPPKIEGLEARP
ncbi:MAG: glycosyltransferase family 2 protein [Cyanophyceae cyanobacterium]